MAIELRELRGTDTFKILRIISKLEIEDQLKQIIFDFSDAPQAKAPQDHKKKQPTKAEQEAAQAEIEARGARIFADIMLQLFANLHKVEDELNRFLADLTGLQLSEIEELPLDEYIGTVEAFFKKPELKALFKRLYSLKK